MDFLFYYKDILFEISKYLSCNDIRRLKFAFPDLLLKELAHNKKDFIRDIYNLPIVSRSMNSYNPNIFVLIDILSMPANMFLLYNRRYDSKTRILACDIDYQELNSIIGRYFQVSFNTYRQFIEPVRIVDYGFVVSLNNGHEWYLSLLKFRQKYDNGILDLGNNVIVDQSMIIYMFEKGTLSEFVSKHRESLSKLDTYFKIIYNTYSKRISSSIICLLWGFLEKEDRSSICASLRALFDNRNIYFSGNSYKTYKKWLDQND